MSGRYVYRPARARLTAFGVPVTPRNAGLVLAQALGLIGAAGGLYVALVVCMAL